MQCPAFHFGRPRRQHLHDAVSIGTGSTESVSGVDARRPGPARMAGLRIRPFGGYGDL